MQRRDMLFRHEELMPKSAILNHRSHLGMPDNVNVVG
jgi:hypothetical protein